jgi:predicted dinucleotide-binding enzyme
MLTETPYAIVGTGDTGSALARLFGRAGLEVRIANTRGPRTISELAAADWYSGTSPSSRSPEPPGLRADRWR